MTVVLESLEVAIESSLRLFHAGQFGEAKKLAAAKLAELRSAWGYDGKSQTQRNYLSTFNAIRARACRAELFNTAN